MAFGIDDALTAAAAGISLADTVIETVRRYRKGKKLNYDFELLLREVKTTALARIDDADLALTQFERMLVERKIDTGKPISQIIADTPPWQAFEQHRLSQIQKRFNQFSDSIYCAGDDIAALARCTDQTSELGSSVVDTLQSKHELQSRILGANSLKQAIEILRERLATYKVSLGS